MCLILCVGSIYAKKEKKVETSYRNALILAYDQSNSVFENEEIKLQIYNEGLWITNKTTKTLFIDKSQCFLNHNGSSRPIFSKDQDEKFASKKGEATAIDEFITVAPKTGSKQNATFVCNMAAGIHGSYSTTETPSGDFTEYDKRFIELIGEMVVESQKADPKGKLCLGSVSRSLLEDESINNIGASISYAFNKRAEEWTTISLSTCVSRVIFAPYHLTIPEDLKKKEKKGFGVKETKPVQIKVLANSPYDQEVDLEKSPLIVADWKGNFKKGTFELEHVGVRKVAKTGFLANFLTLGYAALVAQVLADYYKDIIVFEGTSVDCGKMTYASSIESALQKVK
jgi:hypothetical protein